MARVRGNTDIMNLDEGQIMSLIDGYDFFSGRPDFGPKGTFKDEAEKERTWHQVKEQLVELVLLESEQDSVGEWRFRGGYLPWGKTIESIDAYWRYDKKQPMPWPKPPKLNEMKNKMGEELNVGGQREGKQLSDS